MKKTLPIQWQESAFHLPIKTPAIAPNSPNAETLPEIRLAMPDSRENALEWTRGDLC